MSRIFVYARVSTADQNTDNQVQEVIAAGYAVHPKRIMKEHISGSVAALERPQFVRLLDRLEPGDILIVTKLDRLGRNAMDVRATIERLAEDGIHVHCLALGGADLTSPAGRMTMMVMNAVAEFERDLLIERTQAGLARARAEGKRLGRPPALSEEDQVKVIDRLAAGVSVAQVARDFETTRQSIMRIRAKQLEYRNMGQGLSVGA